MCKLLHGVRENGFVLGVAMTPASASGPEGSPARREHDTRYLPYLALASCHTEEPVKKIYADKGYCAPWNRGLNLITELFCELGVCIEATSCAELIPQGKSQPNRVFLNLNDIEDGFRLGEHSSSERIMRKDTTTVKLREFERERNKQIAKKRYIAAPCGIGCRKRIEHRWNVVGFSNEVEADVDIIPRGKKQYFGLSHLHDRAYRARFTKLMKNLWDSMCRQTCAVKCLTHEMCSIFHRGAAYFTGMAFNLSRGSRILATT